MDRIETLSKDFYLEVKEVISTSLESYFVGISGSFDRTIKIMKSVIGIGTHEVSKTPDNYRTFEPGDIIHIRIYSDSKLGIKIVLEGGIEYDAKFIGTYHAKPHQQHSKILSVATCIKRGYLLDVSDSIERDKKIKSLGI